MSEKAKAMDNAAVGLAARAGEAFVEAPPQMRAEVVCANKDGIKWTAGMQNAVMNQGRNLILNRLFASWTSYSNGALLFLHSASTATNNVWSQISASQVVSYGNNIPAVTFATQETHASNTGSANFVTGSATYAFNASTQTVSGLGILFYSSASGSTNLATTDARLYNYGTFSNGSRQVQNGDSLTVTVSISFA